MSKDEKKTDEPTFNEMVEYFYTIRDEIIQIAYLGNKIKKSGLKRRAILVLLKDTTGVSLKDIGLILDGMSELDQYIDKSHRKAKKK